MDLAARLEPAPPIEAGHSGYFDRPSPGLDPRLFSGTKFKPELRRAILSKLYGFWKGRYASPETWSRVWVAGSGVSYQWHGDRGGVGDLDVLVGVNMVEFLRRNPEFGGIPEDAIAKRFNNEFNTFLNPETKARPGETWAAQVQRMASVRTALPDDGSSTVGSVGLADSAITVTSRSARNTGSRSKTSSGWYESKVGAVPSVVSSSQPRSRPRASTVAAQVDGLPSLTMTTQRTGSGASSAGVVTGALGSSETPSKGSSVRSDTLKGGFEITWYVNPGAADIADITPYAAYDLTNDEWTVPPIQLPSDWGPQYLPKEWHQQAAREIEMAHTAIERYNAALAERDRTPALSPQRRNAEVGLNLVAEQASAIYEDIHAGRKVAFGPGGKGYRDWFNARWQFHKRAGTEQALRAIHDGRSAAIKAQNTEKYGMADLSAQRAILNASLAPHRRRGMFG